MDIGIGLPNTVLGVDRRGILDWAREAERAGFASLGTIDRIAYDNYDSLISLAAAAAVTERIRLTTDILIGPLRQTAHLAKQSATVDHLSGGGPGRPPARDGALLLGARGRRGGGRPPRTRLLLRVPRRLRGTDRGERRQGRGHPARVPRRIRGGGGRRGHLLPGVGRPGAGRAAREGGAYWMNC